MSAAFGVYVHWPFCAQKCPYCDFNSHVRERHDEAAWVESIVVELQTVAAMQDARVPATSVFFGGGTPSLMSGGAVAAVLQAIENIWGLAPGAEITLEANPNSAEQARFRDYASAGVNRLSIGVQALDDMALKALGRLHGADEARRAIGWAKGIFPRTSIDLIYARPDQSAKAWETELREALSFGTEHLSLYQLTIEPGTAYATLARQGKLIIPAEDAAADLYELTQAMCEAAGRPAYEVSNHASVGAESRHNLLYWRYGDYAGVGPGAHGRLTVQGARIATQAERLPERWRERVVKMGHSFDLTPIAQDEAARENLLMALRLSEGLDLAAYESRWGVHLPREKIAHMREAGLLTKSETRLTASPQGRLVLNSLIAELAA